MPGMETTSQNDSLVGSSPLWATLDVRVLAVITALAAALCFTPTLTFDFLTFDDDVYVYANTYLGRLDV